MSAPRWYDHREPAAWGQQTAWQSIYDAGEEALSPRRLWTRDVDQVTDAQGTYTVASYGRVYTVRSLAELAAVTRRERVRAGVVWREDERS